MFKKCLENTKFLCFIGGAAAAVIGGKILKSKKTRELCVKGLAEGMKMKHDARVAFENLKEDAEDIYYDAANISEEDEILDCEDSEENA
ncbi:MAG: DUF1490 domain-containing protein [Firmicutes bacterium]|nr:DUF1490 domain-containing protein [Bacillota bacterium]